MCFESNQGSGLIQANPELLSFEISELIPDMSGKDKSVPFRQMQVIVLYTLNTQFSNCLRDIRGELCSAYPKTIDWR